MVVVAWALPVFSKERFRMVLILMVHSFHAAILAYSDPLRYCLVCS